MRPVYIVLGFLFMGLGVVGVALPVLPTVPFLLLASYCFAKGSDRFYKWFKGTGVYQKHLKDYEETRSMPLKSKLAILLPVSAVLIATMILVDVLPMRIFIVFLLVLKYYYFFFHIKTMKPQAKRDALSNEQ